MNGVGPGIAFWVLSAVTLVAAGGRTKCVKRA